MPIVYTRKRLRPPPPSQTSPSQTPPSETPPSPSRSTTPPKPKKRRRYTQLHIDAGQSDLIKKCSCGMLYTPGEDDHLHKRYHNTAKLPRWSPRTSAKHLGQVAGLTLYLLSENHASKTARRIDHFVSSVLGTVLEFPIRPWIAIVAISKGFVRAFALCERITSARLYHSSRVVGSAEKAILGVRKIWVEPAFRGRGVASRLVNEACLALVYGLVVEKKYVAFSVPTCDGRKFAESLCGRVLVYDTAHHG